MRAENMHDSFPAEDVTLMLEGLQLAYGDDAEGTPYASKTRDQQMAAAQIAFHLAACFVETDG
jgi:hypothetical protein